MKNRPAYIATEKEFIESLRGLDDLSVLQAIRERLAELDAVNPVIDFDPTKPVKNRLGHKARIICTDLVGSHPICAAVIRPSTHYATFGTEDEEYVYRLTAEGCLLGPRVPCNGDLINIPEEDE